MEITLNSTFKDITFNDLDLINGGIQNTALAITGTIIAATALPFLPAIGVIGGFGLALEAAAAIATIGFASAKMY